jgi:serine/threonine-protein kinase
MDRPEIVGRYAIFDRIAQGGMASVHLGRLLGEAGFQRTVAIKRLHPQNALDPHFVAMFLDEARLASRVRHPNVVATLDVVASDDELFLVMEYVEGESLASLSAHALDVRAAVAVVTSILAGLHAVHEAKSDRGEPLDMVHRDVSPGNVIVGVDGVVRLADFGVAKAVTQIHTTREGQLKGKLAYMAPEQLTGKPVTRRTDVFAASVVAWELFTTKRLFAADSEADVVHNVLLAPIAAPGVNPAIDAIVLRGLARDPAARWSTAAEMAQALEAAVEPASASRLGQWVRAAASDALSARARIVARIESYAT